MKKTDKVTSRRQWSFKGPPTKRAEAPSERIWRSYIGMYHIKDKANTFQDPEQTSRFSRWCCHNLVVEYACSAWYTGVSEYWICQDHLQKSYKNSGLRRWGGYWSGWMTFLDVFFAWAFGEIKWPHHHHASDTWWYCIGPETWNNSSIQLSNCIPSLVYWC